MERVLEDQHVHDDNFDMEYKERTVHDDDDDDDATVGK